MINSLEIQLKIANMPISNAILNHFLRRSPLGQNQQLHQFLLKRLHKYPKIHPIPLWVTLMIPRQILFILAPFMTLSLPHPINPHQILRPPLQRKLFSSVYKIKPTPHRLVRRLHKRTYLKVHFTVLLLDLIQHWIQRLHQLVVWLA